MSRVPYRLIRDFFHVARSARLHARRLWHQVRKEVMHAMRNLAQLVEEHLMRVIPEDEIKGDYFLAAIVQDATIQVLVHEGGMPAEEEMAHLAEELAAHALRAVYATLPLNEFLVRETLRGVYLGLVSLGYDPVRGAYGVVRGGTKEMDARLDGRFRREAAQAVAQALEDLGLESGIKRMVSEAARAAAEGRRADRFVPDRTGGIASSPDDPDHPVELEQLRQNMELERWFAMNEPIE
jgi:hypothetical protein